MKILFFFLSVFVFCISLRAQNVGISTINPVFKLDVRGGSINTDSLYRIGTVPVLSVLGNNNLLVGQHAGENNTGEDNTFSGAYAGYFNTGGYLNSFFGSLAGVYNSDGYYNSFFGGNAGFYNTTGNDNSFFGMQSGAYNTTGNDNSFFGMQSGAYNTTGSANSFFGRSAGALNITGHSNSFFGLTAGFSNTVGSNNSFFGDSTGFQNTTGTDNTFMGMWAGYSNTTGNANVFIGKSAGLLNTLGTDNTFMGTWAGYSNTTGNSNAFFGRNAGLSNNTGYSNSFFGQTAGHLNTSGFENSIFGFYAGAVNSSGFENSFFGSNAGNQNQTGSKNSFFGKYAGFGNTSGTSNTAIGFSSFFNAGTLTNATAIGNNARVDCSNCMVLGSVLNVNGAPAGVNVGIGVNSPTAKLSISTTGTELAGTAAGNTLRTNAGYLSNAVGSEMNLANIGFMSFSNSSLGIRAYRINEGFDWTTTSLLLENDVENVPRAGGGFLAISAKGNIGVNTPNPNVSAALDVASTTKGFLPPRMTKSERDAIPTPVAGLMIWCNNCGAYGQIQVYIGIGWRSIMFESSLAIGDTLQGGKVAYIFKPDDPGYVVGEIHGLIAAPMDQSSGAIWGCVGTDLPGANGILLGTGNQNTIDIVNGCSTAGISARICNDLVLGGYTDWYLPSIDELTLLYTNRIAIGGFSANNYWSSTELDLDNAGTLNFANSAPYTRLKTLYQNVRAVRSF